MPYNDYLLQQQLTTTSAYLLGQIPAEHTYVGVGGIQVTKVGEQVTIDGSSISGGTGSGVEYSFVGTGGIEVTNVDNQVTIDGSSISGGTGSGVEYSFVGTGGIEVVNINNQITIDGSSISGGGNGITPIDGVSAENIERYLVICLDPTTSGYFRKATNDGGYDQANVVGIVTQLGGLSENTAGSVTPLGTVTNPSWNWTTGSGIFLSSSGNLTQIEPSVVGQYWVPLGYATSPTSIWFQIGTGMIIGVGTSLIISSYTAPAGEYIEAGKSVFLAHSTQGYTFIPDIVVGSIYLTDNSYRSRSSMAFYPGVAINTAVSGSNVIVQTLGAVSVGGLSVGIPYGMSISGTLTAQTLLSPIDNTVVGLALSSSLLTLTSRPASVLGNGYIMGGYNGGFFSNIDYINFSSLVVAATGATLGASVLGPGGFWSSSAMYSCGGQNLTNAIYKLPFGSAVRTTLSATISEAKRGPGGFCDINKGYLAGGDASTGGSAMRNVIEALTYSNESRATLAATLSQARYFIAPHVINYNKAFLAGGLSGYSNTDVFTFSNESCAAGGALSATSAGSAGASSLTKGYALGGFATDIVNGMLFSNETWGVVAGATLGSTSRTCPGSASSPIATFALGGGNWSAYSNVITTMSFSNETSLSPTVLSTTRMGMGSAIG